MKADKFIHQETMLYTTNNLGGKKGQTGTLIVTREKTVAREKSVDYY